MKKNNKGFTLAELLIVVAIIAVLVAIAIPVFTTQLEKSREATDIANVRSAYAEVITKYLTDNNASGTMTVEAKQTVPNWQGTPGTIEFFSGDSTSAFPYGAATSGSNYIVGITINTTTGDATPSVNPAATAASTNP